MDAVAAQRVPWVRVLDAYAIGRARADAHPGPDPKTNPRGRTDSLKLFDDCLHYCLPGVPDLFNGRLLKLLEQATAEAEARRDLQASPDAAAAAAAAASTHAEAAVVDLGGDGAASSAAPPEGLPGILLARWNFGFGDGPFVSGERPLIAIEFH